MSHSSAEWSGTHLNSASPMGPREPKTCKTEPHGVSLSSLTLTSTTATGVSTPSEHSPRSRLGVPQKQQRDSPGKA